MAVTVAVTAVPPPAAVTDAVNAVTVTVTGTADAGYAGAADRVSRPVW